MATLNRTVPAAHTEMAVNCAIEHLRHSTVRWIDRDLSSKNGVMCGVPCDVGGGGWLLHSGNWDAPGVPGELRFILRHAHTQRHFWVRFDHEGYVHGTFPTFTPQD